MFSKNDLVVYEDSGVCEISDICELSFTEEDPRTYYILRPIFFKDDRIYTPVNNPKVTLRPVISREEALSILHSISQAEVHSFEGLCTTELEGRYRAASKSHRCADLVKLAMSIYSKTRKARRSGRRVSEIDDRYLKRLNLLINGELSVALDIPAEEVPKLIHAEIEKRKS